MVVLGGYIATLKADFVQGIVMLVGVLALIVAVVRCQQVGRPVRRAAGHQPGNGRPAAGVADHIALWATVLMTSFGTWGLPQMIHKYYGIRDDREVKRGTVISTPPLRPGYCGEAAASSAPCPGCFYQGSCTPLPGSGAGS